MVQLIIRGTIRFIDYTDDIMYNHNPTFEEAKAAIDRNITNLSLIKNQTDEICRYAIEKEPKIIRYVHDQNDDICNYAIMKNQDVLKYIRKQTFPIIKQFALLYKINSKLIDWSVLTPDQIEYIRLL